MIDSSEWRRIPLEERLTYLSTYSEDALIRETLTEVLQRLHRPAVAALEGRIADLQAEVTRLERLVTQVTPY